MCRELSLDFCKLSTGKKSSHEERKATAFHFLYNRRESDDYILEQLLRDIDFNQVANTKIYCN